MQVSSLPRGFQYETWTNQYNSLSKFIQDLLKKYGPIQTNEKKQQPEGGLYSDMMSLIHKIEEKINLLERFLDNRARGNGNSYDKKLFFNKKTGDWEIEITSFPVFLPPPNNNEVTYAPSFPAAPPNNNEVTYAPFSDESIQKSIDTLEEDSKRLMNYAAERGSRRRSLYGDETRLIVDNSAEIPREIRYLLDKYDNHSGYLFRMSDDINDRVSALQKYLSFNTNQREHYAYPERSYPNGELKIIKNPVVPLPAQYTVSAVKPGGRRKHRTRHHKKGLKKTRRHRR